MDNPTRQFVRKGLATLLNIEEDHNICTDLEKCIVRHSKDRIDAGGGDAAWDNHKFTNIYKHKFLSIRNGITKNPELRDKLIKGRLSVLDIVAMRPEQLLPEGPYAKQIEDKIHKDMRKEYLTREMKNQEGFFVCGRCRSNKTTYYQLQTRSADEPMTVFVSCLNCDRNWKC